MERLGCNFSYTKYERISESREKLNLISKILKILNYKQLLKVNPIRCLIFTIYDIKKLGKILKIGQEFTLCLEVMKKVKKARGLEENLSEYRYREMLLSKNKKKKLFICEKYIENTIINQFLNQ